MAPRSLNGSYRKRVLPINAFPPGNQTPYPRFPPQMVSPPINPPRSVRPPPRFLREVHPCPPPPISGSGSVPAPSAASHAQPTPPARGAASQPGEGRRWGGGADGGGSKGGLWGIWGRGGWGGALWGYVGRLEVAWGVRGEGHGWTPRRNRGGGDRVGYLLPVEPFVEGTLGRGGLVSGGNAFRRRTR